MDLVTIYHVVTASNHALSVSKNLGEKIRSSGKSEMLGDFLDLQGAMMDLQLKQQDLIRQLEESQARIKELEEALKFCGELERDGNSLYLKTDIEREHPYCMACWGYDRKLVGLLRGQNRDGETILCKICSKR